MIHVLKTAGSSVPIKKWHVHVVKGDDGSEWYKQIQAIADKYLKAWIAAIQLATEQLQSGITLEQIEDAINQGNTSIIESLLDLLTDYEKSLQVDAHSLIGQIINESGSAMADSLKISLRFDLLNLHSVDWIRAHSAELVREVSDETKEAIRQVIEDAFTQGMHPKKAARLIRQMVGLTEKQSLAVQRKWLAMREDPALVHLTDEQIEKRVERYAKKLHRHRAENIARTETMRASNAGQRFAIEQAAEQGLIDKERARYKWILTPDDRLCECCREMKDKEIELDSQFVTDQGESIPHPPLHPSCRCALGMVFKEVE